MFLLIPLKNAINCIHNNTRPIVVVALINLLISPFTLAESLKDDSLPSLDMPNYQFPLISTQSVSLNNNAIDKNSSFNEHWLLQQQDGYKSKEGTAALGKMLQMSAQVLYKNFRDSGYISDEMPDENGDGDFSEMKYKVRLQSDTLKFGLEYQF